MITMVWPSDFSISPATSRVIWSVEPPAAQGTIRLIGRVGFQSAAAAGNASSAAPRAPSRTDFRKVANVTRHPPSCLVHSGGLYGQAADQANPMGARPFTFGINLLVNSQR